MLTKADHPTGCAMLLYELADAHEHLGKLVAQMNGDGAIDEEDYRVQLGHVFAHLNRAWHGRDDVKLADISEDEFVKQQSEYPIDLKPV